MSKKREGVNDTLTFIESILEDTGVVKTHGRGRTHLTCKMGTPLDVLAVNVIFKVALVQRSNMLNSNEMTPYWKEESHEWRNDLAHLFCCHCRYSWEPLGTGSCLTGY